MNNVTALVLKLNNVDYPAGLIMGVGCENATTQATYWRVPITGKGIHTGYRWVLIGEGVTKPTADSVKVLHVVNSLAGNHYWIALQDTGSVTDFTSLCAECCGEPTIMPAVTVPDVIAEETACPDEDGNSNFFAITQALAAGQIYDAAATIDGVALTPAQAEGFASLAALETWADANWAPNTVAVSGTKVTLTSATAVTGSLSVSIKNLFESNAPGALTSGNRFIVNGTINGIALAAVTGVEDGALATIADLLNANAQWAAYGTYSVVSGKIRLVSATATTASIVVTQEVAP